MKSNQRIEEAKKLATELHGGQFRKNGTTPYVKHLIAVAEILSEYTDDDDIIIAGLMHDTIEDIPDYTYEKLVEDCDKRVADFVEGVTEERFPGYKELPREERIQKYEESLQRNIKKIESAGEGATLVSVADKIHNTRGLIDGFEEEGEVHLNRFNTLLDQKLRYYRNILEMARRNLSSPILDRLDSVLTEAETKLL